MAVRKGKTVSKSAAPETLTIEDVAAYSSSPGVRKAAGDAVTRIRTLEQLLADKEVERLERDTDEYLSELGKDELRRTGKFDAANCVASDPPRSGSAFDGALAAIDLHMVSIALSVGFLRDRLQPVLLPVQGAADGNSTNAAPTPAGAPLTHHLNNYATRLAEFATQLRLLNERIDLVPM